MFDSLLIAAVGSNSSPSDNAKSGGETYQRNERFLGKPGSQGSVRYRWWKRSLGIRPGGCGLPLWTVGLLLGFGLVEVGQFLLPLGGLIGSVRGFVELHQAGKVFPQTFPPMNRYTLLSLFDSLVAGDQ